VRHHHEAFTELHPYKRHHHVAYVELRPGLETPPRYSRGITSLSQGTTVNPHLEVHGIKSNSWGTTGNSSLEGSTKLCPIDEAPPWALTTRVMELRPTHTLNMFHQPIRSSYNTNIMYNNPIMQLMLSNSYNIQQHTIPTATSYINHGIIPQPT